jgi:glycosyltransferase involved in cell wall biosynthesis
MQDLTEQTKLEILINNVVHLFPPTHGFDYSGHEMRWNWQFSKWTDLNINHLLLIPDNYSIGHPYTFSENIEIGKKVQKRIQRLFWAIRVCITIIIRRKKIHILHVHIQNWGGLFTALLSKWLGIPSIYEISLLGSDDPGSLKNEKLGFIKIFLFNKFQSILCPTSVCKNICLKNGVDKKKIKVIQNSVDIDIFKPVDANEKMCLRKKNNLPIEKEILIFVGSVKERKGIDQLVKAFKDLYSANKNLYLLIVGPKSKSENLSIDENFVKELKLRIYENTMTDDVNFFGLIKNKGKVAELYRSSDIFILPSVNEGLPNVLLEAMATGLPVVVPKIPIFEEIINHLENGVIYSQGNTKQLGCSILTLIEQTELAQKIGFSGRQYILHNHTFENWQTSLSNYYFSLIGRQKR